MGSQWQVRGSKKLGVGVLLVHYASRDDNARGTSKREDVLDTVIAARKAPTMIVSDNGTELTSMAILR